MQQIRKRIGKLKLKPIMTHTEATLTALVLGSGIYVYLGPEFFPIWIGKYWPSLSIGCSCWFIARRAFPRPPKSDDH